MRLLEVVWPAPGLDDTEVWPTSVASEYRAQHNLDLEEIAPARMVHDRTLETYPALGGIGEPGVTWVALMYIESCIIISTMVHLQHCGIPSLPVHDSLIVPLQDRLGGWAVD